MDSQTWPMLGHRESRTAPGGWVQSIPDSLPGVKHTLCMLLLLVLTSPDRWVLPPLFSEGKSEIQGCKVTVTGIEGDKVGLKPRSVRSRRAHPHLFGFYGDPAICPSVAALVPTLSGRDGSVCVCVCC